jgi:hypothetical protein
MNRKIVMLNIFLVFILYKMSDISILTKRKDPLSGYVPCIGKYPNTITSFSYSPYPVIPGQNLTIRIAGKATVPVEPGALYTDTVFLANNQTYSSNHDYCKLVVEQNGLACPVAAGDFDYTATWFVANKPTDPKDVDVEFGLKISST